MIIKIQILRKKYNKLQRLQMQIKQHQAPPAEMADNGIVAKIINPIFFKLAVSGFRHVWVVLEFHHTVVTTVTSVTSTIVYNYHEALTHILRFYSDQQFVVDAALATDDRYCP